MNSSGYMDRVGPSGTGRLSWLSADESGRTEPFPLKEHRYVVAGQFALMRELLGRGEDLPAYALTVLIDYLDEDRVTYLFPVNALAELYMEVGAVIHIMEGQLNTARLTVETIDAPTG